MVTICQALCKFSQSENQWSDRGQPIKSPLSERHRWKEHRALILPTVVSFRQTRFHDEKSVSVADENDSSAREGRILQYFSYCKCPYQDLKSNLNSGFRCRILSVPIPTESVFDRNFRFFSFSFEPCLFCR